MKRFLKWFLLIVSCLTLGLAAGCGNGTGKAPASSAPSNSKVIRVGMDAAYPPFGFQNTETKAYEASMSMSSAPSARQKALKRKSTTLLSTA